jgi:hypothetical protein
LGVSEGGEEGGEDSDESACAEEVRGRLQVHSLFLWVFVVFNG